MALTISKMNFFYGTEQVLFDINLTLAQGEVLVLLGSSGAGKTTLLRTLNLLEQPQSGRLSIADCSFDLGQKIADTTLSHLRLKVGMVFQQYHLWPHLTVMENLIASPMKVLKMAKDEAIKRALFELERLSLYDFADRYPLMLSGGQQQRVAIARALMMKPEILLFDEPTAALDPQITAQIIEIIGNLRQSGITQVVVTHDVHFAKKVASLIAFMEQGRIVEFGGCERFDNPHTSAFGQYLSHQL